MATNIYVRNDNLLQVFNLTDESTGSFLNDASVSADVLDSAGNTIASISLTYISGTNGNYQGTLPATIAWTAFKNYTVVVTAARGGITGVWEVPATATHRE